MDNRLRPPEMSIIVVEFSNFIESTGENMKTKLILLPSILITCALMAGCPNPTPPDPFNGIAKREMISIAGGTYDQYDQNGSTFFSHTISSFQIAKYEVTYELWYAVRQWAINQGYNFANQGTEGSAGGTGTAPAAAKYEPVTTINWRDAIVWCNACSEMAGYAPVYTYNSAAIMDSRDTNSTACDNAVGNWSANGFRIPTEGEWQFAASNKGATQWDYLSGATARYNETADTNPANGVPDGKDANDAVAVYGDYWDGDSWESTGVVKTADVGSKNANQLAIYDMSGNVLEWCWDWEGSYPSGTETNYRGASSGSIRTWRGGDWGSDASFCYTGYRGSFGPGVEQDFIGFRLARSQ